MAIPSTDIAPKGRVESYNPATGESLGSLPAATADEARAAVARARAAQPAWAALSPRERRRLLLRFRDLVVERMEDIARTDVRETGKPLTEALGVVVGAADALGYYANLAVKLEHGRRTGAGPLPFKQCKMFYRPRGVAAVISPWNYPFFLAMLHIAPALAAGNAVVHKPSEHTPRVGLLVGELARAAGLPDGLVQIVLGDGSVGAAIIDAGVDIVSFTGAPHTGKKVMALAAQHLTPVILELGGKDAAIVLDDADLERAANAVSWGAFINAGQTCVAIKRAIVHTAVYDRFVDMLAERVRKLQPSAGDDAQMGALTLSRESERLDRQVRAAVDAGARLVCGGGLLPGPGVFYAPTVLADCTPDMPAVREESFGPLLTILRAKDDDDALRLANDSAFGLAGSIFSEDRERALAMAAHFHTGGVAINDALTQTTNPRLPFGGVKHSGLGRVGSEHGFAAYCNVQAVMISLVHGKRELYWHPYTAAFRQIWKKMATVIFHGSFRRKMGAVLGRK
jgi:succinate-semialdehyde dehydrogenase/glutarate-semialdehyde dehydrogenase